MQSFVNYDSNCEFPIENLPYGIFSTKDNVMKVKEIKIKRYVTIILITCTQFSAAAKARCSDW